ncbi:MAG: NAD(P)/FAD-dependent oxidoreductase [Planctomycetota bacterium]|nr:NAD(P)/FAD-dependent oxidoreductase [Planctomycetota bacterium]
MPRTYKPLPHSSGPRSSYDAAVIGAGIRGLMTANLLAKEGMRVLLVEQHYVVGGYCSTFQRKGYTFDAASHFYPLLGDPTTMTGKMLADIGIEQEWIKMDPVDQFHLPDGSTVSVSADYDTYLAKLKSDFPAEADAIDRFFGLARKLYLWGVLHFFRGIETSRLKRYLPMTLRDALNQHFQDERLKLVLTADVPHWGSPPNRTSFVFDCMLRLSYFLGNYYPVGGSQKFADELAQRFQEQGGDILLKTMVQRIHVRNGQATGVTLEIGPLKDRREVTVQAGAVVSNADMRLTVEKLVGISHFEPDYVARLHELRASFPCFLSHIGVRDIPRDVLERAHGYYWRGWDSDRVAKGDFDCKIFVPSLYEPGLAPPGRDVIVIQKVTEVRYDEITDWQAHKRSVEDFVLERLESAIPGVREKFDVCLSASAETSHRFTLNYHGAMLGWEMSPDQLGEHRPAIKSPIQNLFFVGQWTQPGGGITPVMVSAMRAAKIVSSGFDPVIESDMQTDDDLDIVPAYVHSHSKFSHPHNIPVAAHAKTEIAEVLR